MSLLHVYEHGGRHHPRGLARVTASGPRNRRSGRADVLAEADALAGLAVHGLPVLRVWAAAAGVDADAASENGGTLQPDPTDQETVVRLGLMSQMAYENRNVSNDWVPVPGFNVVRSRTIARGHTAPPHMGTHVGAAAGRPAGPLGGSAPDTRYWLGQRQPPWLRLCGRDRRRIGRDRVQGHHPRLFRRKRHGRQGPRNRKAPLYCRARDGNRAQTVASRHASCAGRSGVEQLGYTLTFGFCDASCPKRRSRRAS